MMKLFDYFRSSASYRVRIALNYKKIDYDKVQIHLVDNKGEQHSNYYKSINPQELVPALMLTDRKNTENPGVKTNSVESVHVVLTQSLAIIEYLEEQYPNPSILPKDAYLRAEARKLAYIIAADVHPLNNLRVLKYLTEQFGITEQQKTEWYHHWLKLGFDSYELSVVKYAEQGNYSLGDKFSLADICLIPQVYNALRFKLDMSAYPSIMRVYDHCLKMPEVDATKPHEP